MRVPLACLLTALVAVTAAWTGPARAQADDTGDRPAPNWVFGCPEADNCRTEARTTTPDGRTLLHMWVGPGPGDTPVLGAVLPLGLHIPNGVILSFDEGRTAHHELRLLSCHQQGCRAVAALDPALEQRLRAAAEVAVVIRDSQSRQDLALTMPLWGFSAGMDQLRAR